MKFIDEDIKELRKINKLQVKAMNNANFTQCFALGIVRTKIIAKYIVIVTIIIFILWVLFFNHTQLGKEIVCNQRIYNYSIGNGVC